MVRSELKYSLLAFGFRDWKVLTKYSFVDIHVIALK